MLIRRLGEDKLIEAIARGSAGRQARVVKGIGDDASVTRQRGGMALIATTDSLIEGTHFRKGCAPARLLGRKALSISLSDIAAMGAEPLFFLVSLALPPDTEKRFVDELYRGIYDTGRRWGCRLIGGNTARARSIMISTTALGEAPEGSITYRKGARAGDLIFATGALGSSALGLKVLSRDGLKALKGPFKGSVARHLDPEPRLEAGKALASRGLATAVMDISDGLAIDLGRLCAESSKAAVVHLGALPVSRELEKYGLKTGRCPRLDFALTGGEDYELLFTSAESNAGRLASLSRKLGLPFTPIGKILSARGPARAVTVIDESGRPLKLKSPGFEHF